MTQWIKLAWEGMDWTVKKGYEQCIPSQIWDKTRCPEQYPECLILKDNILRTSILLPLPQNNIQAVFIKRHRRRHWKDDVKTLVLPSKAFLEWKTLLQFKRLHLPVPNPLAYGEKRKHGILQDSCLVTEALSSAKPLKDYLLREPGATRSRNDFMRRQVVVSRLAQWVGRLHKRGVYYRDLHGGNIVCQDDSAGEAQLFFVDTGKARFAAKTTPRRQARDLALLYNSLPPGTRAERVRFLQTYLKEAHAASLDWKTLFREIERIAQALTERHIKSRNKRCLKRSTSFMVKTRGKRKYYFRREFSEENIDQAVEEVKGNTRAPDRHGTRGAPILLEINHTDRHAAICARFFQHGVLERVKSVFGYSPGKIAWFKSNGLVVRDVPTPLPLALVEENGCVGIKASMFITEDLSRFDRLDKYMAEGFTQPDPKPQPRRKNAFATTLVRSLKHAYGKKVYFKKLSAEEILVEELAGGSWRFYFVNAAQAALNRRVSQESQISNLVQLNASLFGIVARKDQLRFLFHFFKPLPREERKRCLREVIARSVYS
jgi:heptose I phosphotransferase